MTTSPTFHYAQPILTLNVERFVLSHIMISIRFTVTCGGAPYVGLTFHTLCGLLCPAGIHVCCITYKPRNGNLTLFVTW